MRLRLRLKVRVGSGLERASLCWLLATPSSARREGGWHRANSGIGKASTMIDAMRRAERRSYMRTRGRGSLANLVRDGG